MNEFHFLRPEWFWGFSVFPLLLFFLSKNGTGGGLWQKLCDGVLLRFQLVSSEGKRLFLPFFLTMAAWTLALISLAGPTWEKLPQPAVKKGADTVYVMDISVLMTPTDIKPSRMERARFKTHDFLRQTKDGQNALILYGQEPFVAVPLTTDKRIIDNLLPTVQAGMMGADMPNPAVALERAQELLTQAKSTGGRVIVLSGYLADDDMPQILKAAEKIKDAGHTLSFLGIGTSRGAPIQLPDGNFLTHRGKPVLSALTGQNMEKAAKVGGGVYRIVTLDEADVRAVSDAFPREEGRPLFSEENETKADTWKDFGAVLCIFILPFAAFGYRKGWLSVLLFLLLGSTPARAWSVSDLWIRPDRKEAMAITAGEKPQNPDVFKDPAWRGAAAYKVGDYPKAVSALAVAEDAENLYNQGNALAHAGQYEQALEAYKKALEKSPDHEDAAFNKKYLEEQLKNNQQNQNQNNQDQNKDRKNQQDQQKQQNQDQQKQQKQDQQEQNKEQSEEQQQDQQQSAENGQGQQEKQSQEQRQEQQRREQSGDRQQQQEHKQSAVDRKQDKSDQTPQSEQKAPPEEKTDQNPEKQEQMQWLSVIEDDPSGLLRERIRRHNFAKRRRR